MPDASTLKAVGAAGQLERILHILPKAAQDGGATLEELSQALEVDPKVVVKDLTQVTNRSFYLPAGGGDLMLEIDGERVNLFSEGLFDRPVRLSMPEAVCLGLALRGRLAGRWVQDADSEVEDDAAQLLHSLETTLTTISTEEVMARFEAADLRPDPAGIREVLSLAVEAREECRIEYLNPGEESPEDRTVQPYAMAHGEGRWYLLGWCPVSEGIRTFRMDRVLDVERTGVRFPAPEEFDPADFIEGGRVFRPNETLEVKVRFSPRIARWLAERMEGRSEGDGSLTVTYEVCDPHWIVREVLQYGPDAEVLEPEEVRGWVRGVVGGLSWCQGSERR